LALPVINLPTPLRRRLSRRLVRAAARDRGTAEDMSLGELIETLGDRSFGWCILLFGLINMLPMPVGSNMVTSIPVILLTGQMALGLDRVHLPRFVLRRRVGRKRFQKLVLWLGPVIRPVERLVRPRMPQVFAYRSERILGCFLFVVALALFAPIPLSGYIPAAALCLAAIGLVERDGLVTLAGAGLGLVAIAVTVVVGVMIVLGAEALAN
jgi:hypothetical protein